MFYFCLSSTVTPFLFHDIVKTNRFYFRFKTQSIRSYTNFVTRPLPLPFSLRVHIWMSEPSTTCAAAVPTSLHSPSLLTGDKKNNKNTPFAWKAYCLKMSHVHDDTGHFCHRDTVKIVTVTSRVSVALVSINLPALTRCHLLCFPSVQRSKRAHHTDAPE